MRYSPLVEVFHGEGAEAWRIHDEARKRQQAGEDVILLSVGDPDFPTPEPIVEAAVRALRSGDTHYSDIPGRPHLRDAIAREFSAAQGRTLAREEVIVGAGAQNVLFSTGLCLLGPGDEVIVLEPMYVTYEATLRASGATLRRVAMTAESGFRPDPAALRAAVNERTRAIVLTTPNNPTGVVLAAEELEAIAAIARAHDLWVVVDEVYAALAFERPHVSIASLPGMAERTVTIGSLSKSHAMTGWRVGWAIAPADFTDHVERLELSMLYGLPGFVQEAAAAGFDDYRGTTEAMRARYRARRDLVVDALKDTPGLRVLAPEAGMFVLVDVRATGLSSEDFAWRLLREAGVSTLDAGAFGPTTRGFLRMSFTLDEADLARACQRIDGFMRRL
ncbi:pyridoxal phosphate-dependent aminotransferase [Mangrovibrevibacter kandeliae]|uniref:pyridoxal phosphate-dependent aminotransferase n=1 Tax=Mangrovibrevibacter kandeliae TaxID=2968473 RepID=UPI0021179B6C|nr:MULTISPECIES: aminotransferase class I/II-fold pyridoxal phosphate-dependent enzyme [unclassified Aurantimonas]MCQ8783655.1 aminotransferase class I/II-fold pyridoxal phosphate-dependent enzyme [Aurantimonas sp. CSK15Z-1]MCW4116382.1 aminotransferase class I/II-fold pyridoxal phosphate-dependent enzyme [Aurantimonas sp. MSK8Z-1]